MLKKFIQTLFLPCLVLLAAPTPPLVLMWQGTLGGQLDIQAPVEQQTQGGATQLDQNLWVTNPTGTPWDIDDKHTSIDNGYLDAGQSVSFTEQMVADWANTHILGIEVWSERATDKFVTTVRSDDHAGTNILVTSSLPHTIQGLHGSSAYSQVALFSQFYWQSSSKLTPIPNSGAGGKGRVLDVTWTVTNTDSRRITITVSKNIVNSQLSIYWSYWCPEGYPYTNGQRVFGETSYGWCQAASVQAQ